MTFNCGTKGAKAESIALRYLRFVLSSSLLVFYLSQVRPVQAKAEHRARSVLLRDRYSATELESRKP
jgi:hypothetical protein